MHEVRQLSNFNKKYCLYHFLMATRESKGTQMERFAELSLKMPNIT
jgi:hypothetical protein